MTTNFATTYWGETTTGMALPENAGQCFWDADCPSAPYGYVYSCLRDHWYDWNGNCAAVPLEIPQQLAASATDLPENRPYGNSCNQQNQCRPDEYCNF